MEPRGRGRASRGGRARGEPSSGQQPTRPGGGPGGPPPGSWGRGPQGPPPQQQRPVQQPPQGAWGRQPQGPPQVQPQQQSSQQTGRGSRVGGGEEHSRAVTGPTKVVTGGGDPGSKQGQGERGGGNGGVRGRTNRSEIISTKPAHIKSKQGNKGQRIRLTANYFQLLNKPNWCLQQYRVDFNPEVDDTRSKKRLVQIAYKKENDIGGFLFDGSVLFSAHRLQPDPLVRTAKLDDQDPVTMSVRWVSEVVWTDWHYLQVFNILVRRCMHLMGLQLIRRHYFDTKTEISIPDHKLCLWPGYATAIRQHEKDILMNVELMFKIMRQDNVYDLLLSCVDRDRRSDTNAFVKKVVGMIVLTYYNNKTYRIDDVDFKSSPRSTFTGRNGEVSYMDYYKERYRINIQVPTQPMLVSRSSAGEIRAGMPEIIYLVPELCQLTGLSDDQRANFQLMSALAKHTRVGPGPRQQKLQDFVRKVTNTPEAMREIKQWDMDVAKKLVEFDGRVLEQEKIIVGNDIRFPSGPKADWTFNLRANPMVVMEPMQRLAVITPAHLQQPTDDFMRTLNKAANGMKWNMTYRIFPLDNDRSGGYLDKLEEVINQGSVTMILCVLQSKTADRYNAIKKKCCVDRGVPTQVVVMRSIQSKNVMSIATKVAIQMNCKIGGAPWAVQIPIKGLMVVGYDVCRDTASRGKSFGGMVASVNSNCTRYYSSVSEHTYEEELSNNFAAYMVMACRMYREQSGAYPSKIVIYRDGVGDGQLQHVLEHEVKSIVDKLLAEIYSPEDLKMSFIIVSKRVNTRIFDGQNNPPPGTVVDNTVTLPERYDFFIVSQCVNQGTVAPTNFNIIYDRNMGLSPDHMQMLTYKLCHMYYNWSGTVRVPAPCQYAHKLAFLTAQSLHRPAHNKLSTLLYFL